MPDDRPPLITSFFAVSGDDFAPDTFTRLGEYNIGHDKTGKIWLVPTRQSSQTMIDTGITTEMPRRGGY